MVAYLELDLPDLEAATDAKAKDKALASRISRGLIAVHAGIISARQVCCCCRRRAAEATVGLLRDAADARSLKLAKAAADPALGSQAAPPGSGDDLGYALLETPRRAQGQSLTAKTPPLMLSLPPPEAPAREDDFYDARSEVGSDDCGSPRQAGLVDICLNDSVPSAFRKRQQEAQERLATLLAIERRCREGAAAGADRSLADDLTVEDILSEDTAQLWFCHSKSCPFVIGCLWCKIPGVSVEDAVQAIQCPKQRMSWDGDSFSSFEVLKEHDTADPTREDVVFTVIPVPRPVRHREILQHRWQVPLTDGGGGGQALLMKSFEDSSLKPVDPQRVRAFTHLSGYILRPVARLPGKGISSQPDDLEIVVVSQCDLGGALPGWFQNLARRMAKHRCVAWGGKLREHCQRLAKAKPGGS